METNLHSVFLDEPKENHTVVEAEFTLLMIREVNAVAEDRAAGSLRRGKIPPA